MQGCSLLESSMGGGEKAVRELAVPRIAEVVKYFYISAIEAEKDFQRLLSLSFGRAFLSPVGWAWR